MEGLVHIVGRDGSYAHPLPVQALSGLHKEALRKGQACLFRRRPAGSRQCVSGFPAGHPGNVLRGKVVVVVVGDQNKIRIMRFLL